VRPDGSGVNTTGAARTLLIEEHVFYLSIFARSQALSSEPSKREHIDLEVEERRQLH
jgi:hypothetical protein